MIRVSRSSRRACAFRKDQSGATAVEFALVAPLLCFALLSLVEIGMMGMMCSGLDNAVVEPARRIRTGRDDAPTSATSFEDQICAHMGGSTAACHTRLTTSVQRFSKFAAAGATVTAPPADQFDKGGPGDIIIVKVDYNWPLMTPFVATAFHRDGPLSVVLSSRVAFKNEPYK
jgi:Flp pilus assembly protein TadG